MSFVNELKRRNVFRVAIAYLIVAWLIAQVAALALDSFGAPVWVIKTVLFLLVIGFPLALIFAWAFELTPEGLRRESAGEVGETVPTRDTQTLDRLIIVVLILAVGYFSYDKYLRSPGSDGPPVSEASVQQPASSSEPESATDAAIAEPSIAVLPFVNMSDDPGNEYFSEGLSEELLNLLARIPELRVAARTSSFSYKGKDTQVPQIADELNVDHVLEGSVRKSGDRVRITVQLIKASDGYHVFSQTYDRTLEDIFAVQDEIASALVDSLRLTILGEQPKSAVVDSEVYALYLKGRYLNNLKGKENWENAIMALKEALAIDPQYAPAWSELSTTYRFQFNNALLDRDEGIKLARDAAEQALALNEELASAWISLSYIRSLGAWDWSGAEQAAQKARELEPRNADVLNGVGNIATILGRTDVSISAFEEAAELDPLNQSALNGLGLAYMHSGQFAKAESAFRLLLKLNPQYPWGHANLGTLMLFQGQTREALDEIRKNPENHFRNFREIIVLISLQEGAAADPTVAEYIRSIGQIDPFWAANIHAWRGDVDAAFESLERALEQRNISLTFILSSPFLENLKEDPRWDDLLDRIDLLDAYAAMKRSEESGS
jgi:TolB-like protein/lipoprotein NlpI